ncbi:MAG: DUF1552 domain-containing protein [Myxococcota bacterium]
MRTPPRRSLNRRRFLAALGASGLAYPFLRALPSQAADELPKYLVLLFTPNGVVHHLWGAECAAPSDARTPSIASPLIFRESLAPLEPFKNKVIVLDGLNVKAADGPHEAGMGALWTGVRTTENGLGPSIDQAVAQKLAAPTPFRSLELMVRSSEDFTTREVKTRMIYEGRERYIDPFDDPVAARAALFPSATPGGVDKRAWLRKRVLADLNHELGAVSSKLCREDRLQVQAMQSAWNDLDQQLERAGTASLGCAVPTAAPPGFSAPSSDFPLSAKLQMDILALALACDLTRVASLQFSTATSQVTHTWLGSDQNAPHHDLSHRGPYALEALGADVYAPAAAELYPALSQLRAIDRFYASQVAYLVKALSELSVGGKSLLEQTVICWGSEIDIGALHNHNMSPFVLLGGGGGRLKTNRVVRFPVHLDADPATSEVVDRSHNDLLLTLASVMGVELASFGDAELCSGVINEILV